jgi:cyclic pyranopterin phosphate synthase
MRKQGAEKKSVGKRGKLSHYDAAGRERMVDVGGKGATRREAEASAFVAMGPEVLRALPTNKKGDALEIARVAGIMAAKRTAELIPLCHSLPLNFVDVTAELVAGGVAIRAVAATTAETGVEMEAMVAASVAALTVYDMCKGLDKGIKIEEVQLERKRNAKSGDMRKGLDKGIKVERVQLERKSGGKSGEWKRG